ncbi:DUF2169 domain-containing protein [Paracoccus sp. MC1854]|uniref:DUF2169 family type VI secretion system accessory protein n=1 Tax=Paracoccus sp. MC1854 TaxID=2760306 RepID=UPI001602802B|nr:DUF2169 domain-containing protein [Paracoccus sp. MC1854]MBB1490599.1 DUF2169 domain-containing protein [Paracoccus sp. MC1854]
MQILDQTRFPHQMGAGMDVAGRSFMTLTIKGSFAFPDREGDPPRPLETQRPLVMADEYTGAPGFSAPLWESDFAFRKPACDVVLNGAAHAPGGRPVERLRVGLAVGGWSKQFDVVGQREWRTLGPAITATRPYPFRRMPFSYDTAFGGPDRSRPPGPDVPVYAANPVGLGFATATGGNPAGLALPNTEAPGEEVASPYGSYRPMALGPYGRGWPLRLPFGGTYDQNWVEHIAPFLPPDFDECYYQMAPPDQQVSPLAPLTPVVLVHLTPRGREAFRLPDTRLPIRIWRGADLCLDGQPLPDSLLIDAEARVFMLVWRVSVPVRRTLAEFSRAWIGPPTEAMLRAEREGRGYLRLSAVLGEEAEP